MSLIYVSRKEIEKSLCFLASPASLREIFYYHVKLTTYHSVLAFGFKERLHRCLLFIACSSVIA